jgi:hypothetical protein
MRTPFFSILRLESRFPRPIGDSANPQTHGFPVRVAVVDQATVSRVVYEGGRGIVSNFIDVAKEQIASGAIAVGTSCGFLFEHQQRIQNEISAPFLSSSLTELAEGLNEPVSEPLSEPVAILTFDDDVLSRATWFKRATQQYKQCLVRGLPKNGHLYDIIRNDKTELDIDKASAEVVQTAIELATASVVQFGLEPSIVLFECTNLGPYKAAVGKAFKEHNFQCALVDYNDVMAKCWYALQK